MALLIWCDPRFFPTASRVRAVTSALDCLAARGVTLEQAQQGQAAADAICDMPDHVPAMSPELRRWHDAWFAAIEAAEAVVPVSQTPMGAMLVLDETDGRFY